MTLANRTSPKFSVVGLVPGGNRNVNLAKSFIAARNLHAKESKAEIFATLEEIVANLVGSEDFAIYELHPGDDQLISTVVRTTADRPRQPIPIGRGMIGKAAQSGQIYVRQENATDLLPADEAMIEACIPLVGLKGVLGILVLYSLLPQKSGLDEGDIQFLRLVAINTAAAIERLAAEREQSKQETAKR